MEKSKNANKLTGQFGILCTLTKRHLKMFFKNKMTFFFSLMVPLVTILIYFLFLRGLEKTSVISFLQNPGPDIDVDFSSLLNSTSFINELTYLIDKWMLSGVIAVSCITVSFNTCYIMIADQENGVNRDFVSSPISKNIIVLSYFLYNFIVTFLINLIVLILVLFYIVWTGTFFFSFSDILLIVVIIIYSVISSTLVTIFLASFRKIAKNFNSVIALVSSGIGFLIGAFMPGNMVPSGVNYFMALIPGTYSTSLLRSSFLDSSISHLMDKAAILDISIDDYNRIYSYLTGQFSMNVNLFGLEITYKYMYLVLFIFIVIFLILNLSFARINLDRGLAGPRHHPKHKAKQKTE